MPHCYQENRIICCRKKKLNQDNGSIHCRKVSETKGTAVLCLGFRKQEWSPHKISGTEERGTSKIAHPRPQTFRT
jgi:hypothetical protein